MNGNFGNLKLVIAYAVEDIFGGPVERRVNPTYGTPWYTPEARAVVVLYTPDREWDFERRDYGPERPAWSVRWADNSESLNPGGNYYRTEPGRLDIRADLERRGYRLKPAPEGKWAPVRAASESAAVIAAAIKRTTTAADLLDNLYTMSLCTVAAEAGKAYSADLLDFAPKSEVVVAVAGVRAAVEARRLADAKQRAKDERAAKAKADREAKRKAADPRIMPYPHGGDENVVLLKKAVAAAPADLVAQMALADRWREMGVPDKAIPVLVSRWVRWSKCRAALTAETAKGGKLRAAVRERAGCGGANSVPVKLVGLGRAGEAPTMTGEAPSSTFKGGGACRSPGAALRAGYKVEYHADTREVTVGVEWLESNLLAEKVVARAR